MRFSLNEEAVAEFGCIFCPTETPKGLGFAGLSSGNNSGHQAVNLAFLLGAKRILLLGFDMGAKGQHHFFGNHSGRELTNPTQNLYKKWKANLDEMIVLLETKGVEVINYSRKTTLNCKRGIL
jgi:hypothetical protein